MKSTDYMLWQFNPKNDIVKEVEKAVEYYKQKYGNPPSILMVNPEWKEVKIPDEMNLVLKVYRPVLSNLMWIGEE